MTVTDTYAHGGLAVGGSAATAFTHGPKVDSDIEVLWDFGAGLEDVTSFVYDLETVTGRDWPSQLQGKAGPGRLKMRLDNRDGRFSYFLASSPLNQGGRSLDPGAKIRVQTAGVTDVDPVLLARDRFDGATGAITTDEAGTPWTHLTATPLIRVDGVAVPFSGGGTESAMVLDVGAADYFVQATVAELGDNVVETAQQELDTTRLIYRWADDDNYSYLSYGPADNTGSHVIEGVDVVAGVETSIYGPFGTVGRTNVSDGGIGDHRRRVTIGVLVDGTDVHYYINGARVTTTAETALQGAATHVGLSAYYGLLNRAPSVDQIAVWDTIPAATEGVIWTGNVVDVFPDAPAPGAPRTVTVTAEGTLAQMAAAKIEPSAWAGSMRTGIALGDAVERAGLLYPPGVLARGDTDAGSSTSAEITALAHARKLEEVEAGFLREAPEGWLVFEDRSHRAALTPVAAFSDQPGAQFGYQSITMLQWRRELINRITAGVSYGSPNFVTLFGAFKAASGAGVQRTVTLNLPLSINDGDLFVVIIVSTIADDDENWLVPLWWVRERDTGASSSKRTQVYTHISDSSDAGDPVTFYNDSASAGGAFIAGLYQFSDWYGTHEGIALGEFAAGPSFAGADPEALLPPWGDTNATAFIAHRCGVSNGGAGSIADETYPLGYVGGLSDFQNGIGSNIFDCGMMRTFKVAMTALEDPGTFTGFSGLQDAETSVIAIRGKNGSPPEPRGRLRVTRNDIDSQRRHNTVASYDGTDLFASEDDAETWCNLMLARYARLRPVLRLTFTATVSGAYRSLATRLRLSDKVRVVSGADGIDAEFHVENIAHRWTHGAKLWEVTVELSPAG